MGIIENYKAWRRKRIIKAAIAQGLTVPSQDRLRKPWLPHWWRGDYTLQNSELIFSAVSRLSNSLSAMPVQLYKGSIPQKSDVNDLLRYAPNPNMTSCQFFRTLEACRCTYGNAYALKIYGPDMSVERLDILDPMKVEPIIEKTSGELWYRITPDKEEARGTFYVHNYNMIHVQFVSTSGIRGVNPVSVLFDTLSYNDSIQKFSVDQLEKGVNAAIVLEAPATLGESQKAQMIEDFMNTYRETSGNILLLESGVNAKSLNLSPVDSKLFEVEKIARGRVAMVYNIPPHLMGDYSSSSYSSQEQSTLEFLTTTETPIVTMYEQELNRKMISRENRMKGWHWEFDMNAILRADASTMAEVNYKALRSGWSTPDEIRAAYGKPPLPGGIGKKALVSQDLATLEYTVNQKTAVLMSKLERGAAAQEVQNAGEGNGQADKESEGTGNS